ncbi:hypothetical protein DYB28_007837 [Aphanomyces astaci]|uniref:Uncharacterized protein n=1 Tax=Aphanomyces astaci TaxID=112090 RepID=A0A9X8DTT2_APHAT|nr:hypothetical protein DYB28_007837 [Aphanomyces astaci]
MSAVCSTAPYRTICAGSKHGRECFSVESTFASSPISHHGLLIVLLPEGRRKFFCFQLSSFQLGITRHTLRKAMAVGKALAQTQQSIVPGSTSGFPLELRLDPRWVLIHVTI